mmetsp:Transcript_17093/g.29367  ORF Transcript_17093/g.29367 Transcript_17093/m.29367 type:complete len:217 (+) Transcript_17093:1460-2110(+)
MFTSSSEEISLNPSSSLFFLSFKAVLSSSFESPDAILRFEQASPFASSSAETLCKFLSPLPMTFFLGATLPFRVPSILSSLLESLSSLGPLSPCSPVSTSLALPTPPRPTSAPEGVSSCCSLAVSLSLSSPHPSAGSSRSTCTVSPAFSASSPSSAVELFSFAAKSLFSATTFSSDDSKQPPLAVFVAVGASVRRASRTDPSLTCPAFTGGTPRPP